MQNQLWSAAPRIVNLPFQLSFTHQNNHSNLFDFLFPKPPASMSITSLLNSEFPFRLSTCCKQRCNMIASDPHLHSTCDPGTFGEVNKCTTAAKKGSKTEFSLFVLCRSLPWTSWLSAVRPHCADLHHGYVSAFMSYTADLRGKMRPTSSSRSRHPPTSNLTSITVFVTKT